MNLHQLKIFSTVAKLGSFSRAAEALRISQPSVSIQVGDLERSLGVDLFEQLGKRIYLTEAGRTLEEYARKILGLVDEATTAVAEVKGLHRGRLTIGASTTPGTYILPMVIGRYQGRFPQISVTLEIANTRRVQEKILRNEIDLGVVGWAVQAHNLTSRQFSDDELVLVASPEHPLASIGSVSAKQLRDHRLILRERGSGTREAVEQTARDAGLAFAPSMEFGSNEAIKEAVAARLGVAILSRRAVAGDVAAGRLVIVPMDLVIRRPLFVVHHSDKRVGQALKAFMEILEESVRAVAP